jgi:hypothetical protein
LLPALSASVSAQVKYEPSDDLEKTVREYYGLIKKGSFAETWKFERRSLKYKEKEEFDKEQRIYISKESKFLLKDFQILEIGKEGGGEKGFTSVSIRLISEYPPLSFETPKDRVMEMSDLWEKIDGKWYHVKRGIGGEYF